MHLNASAAEPLRRAKAVGSALAAKFDTQSSVILALGGDIAYHGRAEQYVLAKQLVDALRESLNTAGFASVDVVVAPGNHDCNYRDQDEEERLALWAAAQDIAKAPAMFRSLSSVQKAFKDWEKDVSTPGVQLAPTLVRTCIVLSTGEFCLDTLNTSWSSILDKREGHLAFCEIDAPRLGDGSISVLVAHHPPNWFQQEHKSALQRWIDETYDVVLYGHEHYNDESERRSRHSGAALNIVAGSAFYSAERASDDGFSVLGFCGDAVRTMTQVTYRWAGEKFVLKGQLTKREFVPNPAKIRPRRSFTKAFLADLEDPGMQLNHPGVTRAIRLSELLIEPKLLLNVPSQATEADPSTAISATSLLRSDDPGNSIKIVFGPELSGKSTLCKFLSSVGHADGLVPLWLNVSSLSSPNSGEITAWVNRAVEATYVGGGEVFYQSDMAERVVLLDGLERLKGGAAARVALIERCAALAGRLIVLISASSATEGLVLLGRGERRLPEADIYEVVPLSKQSTHELLRRWYSLGIAEGQLGDSAADIEARCRQVATRMSAMLGRHGLPPFPLSVLLLLQLTEAVRESDAIVADGSFGYIMESLIVTEMQRARVSVSVGIAVGYLAEFAWFLESQEGLTVDEEGFSAFHKAFESAHGLTVPERQIKRDLAEARFLTVEAGAIKFRYPYLFHFFLAKHLSAVYATLEGQALVANLIRYIHTDKAASVLTFLAHFSSEADLVERLLTRAESIHSGASSADFWVASSMFARFNTLDAKQELLAYDSKEADEEISGDELTAQEQQGGEVTQGEMFPTEEDTAGWTSALKLIHVLGQVLRSRSTRMDVDQKSAVILACIRVARKTLGFAFEELGRDAPALVQKASGAFEKLLNMNREKAARQANSFLGWLVVALSCTYIFRVGRACGADEFRTLNASLLAKAKDKNDRLFLLSARILGERVLVEKELLAMYEHSAGQDILPSAIVRRLARYRLHISPPDDMQRRRIARKMNLGNSAGLIARSNIPE